MGATPAQIAMVSAASPSPSAVPAGMTPKQAAALQAQLAKASTPQEAMKIAQAHGLNPQQASYQMDTCLDFPGKALSQKMKHRMQIVTPRITLENCHFLRLFSYI